MPVDYLSHRVISGTFIIFTPLFVIKSVKSVLFDNFTWRLLTTKFTKLLLLCLITFIAIRLCSRYPLAILVTSLQIIELAPKLFILFLFAAWMKFIKSTHKYVFGFRAIISTFVIIMVSMCIPGFMNLMYICFVKSLLIRLCCDVHPNPEPVETELSFLFSNINSISADNGARFDCLERFMIDSGSTVIALCEVGNITNKIDNYKINVYNIASYTSENRGLLVYAHDSVVTKVRNDLITFSPDFIWLDIIVNYTKTTLGVYYRSPSQSPAQRKLFMANFSNAILLAQQTRPSMNSTLLIMGDFKGMRPRDIG